jgi:hypothetical protein
MKATYKLLFAVFLFAVVGLGGWFAWSSQSGNDLANLSANAGAKLSDEQVQQLLERVSRFMVMPSDEQPSVVVLRDAQTLAEQQSFYRGAKDGDILIVYSTRAIIYDAKANKLVNVGPIVRNEATPPPSLTASASEGQGQVSPSVSATPAVPEKVIVDVRNGTSTAGLAGATASDLKKEGRDTWLTIGKLGDAAGSFTQTTIIDLSKGKKPGALAELERILGVKAVTEVPKGEATSTADILVIVGK